MKLSNGSATTSQTSGLDPAWSGILQGLGTSAAQVAQQPYNPYQGPMVANQSPLQTQAAQGFQGLMANPAFGQAQNTYSQAQDRSMNPFMDQIGGRVTTQVTDAYNRATNGTRSNYNSPGNFGSARQNLAQDRNDVNLSTGLADGLGSLYGGEWTNMQNRALQGAQGTQGLASTYANILGSGMQAGNTGRNYEQQVIDANRQSFDQANNYGRDQLNWLTGLFGNLSGSAPRTSTTTGPGASQVGQGLAGAMLASNMMGYRGGSGSGGGGGKGG